MTESSFRLEVPAELERSHGGLRSEAKVDESALALLKMLTDVLGVSDLGDVAVLDVGCGIKFTRAIVNHDIVIGSYRGVDVYRPVVEFLTESVADPRFSFAHFDVRNERYNPGGAPLSETTSFPVGDDTFDVALGYSLFTHLDPTDAEITLRHMRSAAAPGGRAVFTIFLDEHSGSGLGWVDQYSEALGGSVAGLAEGSFKDAFADDPLRVALYDRDFAERMLAATGWRVDAIHEPTPYSQHTVVASVV